MKILEDIILYFAGLGVMGVAFWGMLWVVEFIVRLTPFH